MKLRCVTNSIRLRLRKSDVSQLKKYNSLVDSLQFPGNKKWTFGISLTEENNNVEYNDDQLLVILNKQIALDWMNSNDVSLKFSLKIDQENDLTILVEKDFPCKHTGDDFEDTYHELEPAEASMYRASTQSKKNKS